MRILTALIVIFALVVLSDAQRCRAAKALSDHASIYHTCAITIDDVIYCWGYNNYGKLNVPADTVWSQVTCGWDHTCGLRKSDNKIVCWGLNAGGQCNVPDDTYIGVSAGSYFSCGLTTSNTLRCWGNVNRGEGNVPSGVPFSQLSAGYEGAYAITDQGDKIYNWGASVSTPQESPKTYTAVSGGTFHVCALKNDSTPICWGNVAAPPLTGVTSLSTCTDHTCAVTVEGVAVCWGNNYRGEIYPPAGTYTAVTLGRFHACGILSDKSVACWGSSTGFPYAICGINPALVPTVNSINYVEGETGVVIDNGITVRDGDDTTLASLSVEILNEQAGDLLESSLSNSGSYTNGIYTYQLVSSLDNYELILRSIKYRSTSENPSSVNSSRTISFTVSDGKVTSTPLLYTVNVIEVNDATVLTASHNNIITYLENSGPVIIDGSIQINDVDNTTLLSATVTITGGYEISDLLSNPTYPSVGASYIDGQLTVIGENHIAFYQSYLQTVAFSSTADYFSTNTRTITMVVSDGASNSNTLSYSITITPVNDSPVFIGRVGTLTYVEGSAGIVIDDSVSIIDPDNTEMRSLSVIISSGMEQNDVLGNPSYADVGATYNANTGTLSYQMQNTTDFYQSFLQTVTFYSTSKNIQSLQRTIVMRVYDGTATAALSYTIDVIAINDPPVLSATKNTPVSYIEASPGVVIDDGLTLTDVDNTSATGVLVRIVSGFHQGDMLSNLAYSASYDNDTGELRYESVSSIDFYQAYLRSVTYHSTSANPTNIPRTVTMTVFDGDVSSNIVSYTINVIPVNNAPVLSTKSSINTTGNATTNTLDYIEGSFGVVIDSDIVVTDEDSETLMRAIVTIVNVAEGDMLESDWYKTGRYNSDNGSYIIEEQMLLTNYQLSLRSMIYYCTSNNATLTPRLITVTVNDGYSDSNIINYTVNILPNEKPIITPSTTQPIVYDQTINSSFVVIDSSVNVSDVDSANLTGVIIQIDDVQPADTLFNHLHSETGTYNTTTGIFYYQQSLSIADYQTYLASMAYRYSNNASSPFNITKYITMMVFDGFLQSNLTTYSINVIYTPPPNNTRNKDSSWKAPVGISIGIFSLCVIIMVVGIIRSIS